MTYFYNSHTGLYVNESPPSPGYFLYEADLHLGLGWHAYGSLSQLQSDVKAHGWPGPFLNGKGNPAGWQSQAASEVGGTAASGVKNAIGSGWSLTFGNTTGLLSRILKVIFGGILIISGVLHMTGVDKSALGIASKVVIPA